MKKKFVGIAVGVFAIMLILVITTSSSNPVKNTKWESETHSVLSFNDGYEWSYGEDYAKGSYEIYKGSKAKSFLDKVVQERISQLADFVPEGERFGIEDEANKQKKEIDNGAFIIEERLDETVVDGQNIKPQNNVYLAKITKEGKEELLTLTNVRTYRGLGFHKFTGEEPKLEEPKIKEAENIVDMGFDYAVPTDYVVQGSFEDSLILAKGTKTIMVSAMKETPLYGIIDEHPDAVEYAAKVNGFMSDEQMGPFMNYIFLFENDGTTYQIEGNSKTDVTNFVNSIEI